ncbi:DUF5958 family protein [Streptomyces sp. MB22_4]|uniref:DUF5958 family protein n=1 Tax=Streptomyces sp. MB22_4 TaxID=3383120 RepID=UPI0039A1DE92
MRRGEVWRRTASGRWSASTRAGPCCAPGAAPAASLPEIVAFRVLVSVFAVADTHRRETYCEGPCGHAWHHLPAVTEQP